MSLWLKRFLVGIAVLTALAAASTQAPSHPAYQWHTFFGGDPNSGATRPATAVDAFGNLYVTGATRLPWDQDGNPIPGPLQDARAYLTKISPTGQLLWSKFYSGYGNPTDLTPVAITLDSAGDIFIAGYGNIVTSFCRCQAFVMEADPDGNKIWGTNFGSIGSGGGIVHGMAYDATHNWVYITGQFSQYHVSDYWGDN